jgi:hypothetical protein
VDVHGIQHRSTPIPAGLPEDIAQRADRDVPSRVRHGDVARFGRVLELLVIAFPADANPTVGLKPLDHLGTPHVAYQYTIRKVTSSRPQTVAEFDFLAREIDFAADKFDFLIGEFHFTVREFDFLGEKFDFLAREIVLLTEKFDFLTREFDFPNREIEFLTREIVLPAEKIDFLIREFDFPTREIEFLGQTIEFRKRCVTDHPKSPVRSPKNPPS